MALLAGGWSPSSALSRSSAPSRFSGASASSLPPCSSWSSRAASLCPAFPSSSAFSSSASAPSSAASVPWAARSSASASSVAAPAGAAARTGRYAVSNPLRREAGLRLLTANLPAGLRRVLLGGLRHPPLAVQSAQRQRLTDTALAHASAQTLLWYTLTELEVTRRVLEAPGTSLTRLARKTLLVEQGASLRRLYAALTL